MSAGVVEIHGPDGAARGGRAAADHHIDFLGADGDIEGSIDNVALMTLVDDRIASYRRATEEDDVLGLPQEP